MNPFFLTMRMSCELYVASVACASFCVPNLLAVIPPTPGLFAALSLGFGGGLYVESGEGC